MPEFRYRLLQLDTGEEMSTRKRKKRHNKRIKARRNGRQTTTTTKNKARTVNALLGSLLWVDERERFALAENHLLEIGLENADQRRRLQVALHVHHFDLQRPLVLTLSISMFEAGK